MALEFLQEYFIDPINNFGGYNPVNTIVYFAILFIVGFYLIYPYLNKKGLKFDKKFSFSLLPYILFGVMLRVINSRIVSDTQAIDLGRVVPDAMNLGLGITQTANPFSIGFWMFTPGVWIATFTLTIIGLLIAKFLAEKKNIEFMKTFTVFGAIFSIPLLLLSLIYFRDFPNFLLVVFTIGIVYFAVNFILKFFPKFNPLKSIQGKLALTGQIIDSTATFYAVGFFGYGEQHFVSSAILGLHPAFFIAVKVAFILAILYLVDKEYSKDDNFRGFIKTVLIILGFATGTASLFKIGLIGTL